MSSLLCQTDSSSWTSNQVISIGLWIGFVAFALTLFVLWRTRWGQVKPLSKCVALSVLGHLLLLAIAYTTQLPSDSGLGGETIAPLHVVEWDDEATPRPKPDDEPPPEEQPDPTLADTVPPIPIREPAPWERNESMTPEVAVEIPAEPADTSSAQNNPPALVALTSDPTSPSARDATTRPWEPIPQSVSPPPPLSASPVQDHGADERFSSDESLFAASMLPDIAAPPPQAADLPAGMAGGVELPADQLDATLQAGVDQLIAGTPEVPIANPSGSRQPSLMETSRSRIADRAVNESITEQRLGEWLDQNAPRRLGDGAEVPELYRMRSAARSARVVPPGATIDSEAGVDQALRWLARNQEADGRWDASRHGAGREDEVLGENRDGAGGRADTGITGLALLALLGHGHTHLEGEHRATVQRGLEFLLVSQGPQGELYGDAEVFARMYSHSIATIALTEAYAMTGDPRLVPGVDAALSYSRRAQHSGTGGWRYRPGEPGDMSQFGWQVMALRAGEQAGFAIPESTRLGMHRFLESCSTGRSGGLSSYRPREAASPTMTAESLACRYWLGMQLEPTRVQEAVDTIRAGDPADSNARPNLYFLYYAALALHEHGGSVWSQWNGSLQQRLLASQELAGPDAGSWAPDTRWGGYGGRVYSTAVATLCLEIPYRYSRAQR